MEDRGRDRTVNSIGEGLCVLQELVGCTLERGELALIVIEFGIGGLCGGTR